ncbi:MAG: hypothetical protein QOH06_748 [Acidobacteriota bacterium]|nr:hypothetical protein [Acidobacteriota bacterium]
MKKEFRYGALVVASLLAAASISRGDMPEALNQPAEASAAPALSFVEGLGSEWLSTSRPIGTVDDVTARTGVAVTGGVSYWETPLTDRVVEHVAGRSPSGELHVFWWGADGAVHDVNVSAKTGILIAGSPVAWLGATPREHIAAIDPAGALVLFTWTPASDWTAQRVGASGKTFTGNVVRWLTPATAPVEHLAATTSDGEIMVFWRSNDGVPFSYLSVTAKTGVRSSGLGGALTVKTGDVVFEHLAAAGTDGKLYDLIWSPLRDWTAFLIPLPAGHLATPDIAAWRTLTGMENVAVRTQGNALIVLSRSGAGLWSAADLTGPDGEQVTGRPAPYPAPIWTDALAVSGQDGEALVFWRVTWSPMWQVLSLTDLTGAKLAGAPAAQPVDGGPRDIVAGAGPDFHLRVLRDFTEARFLTERLQAPFEALHTQNGTRRTVTILWNPEQNAVNCMADTGPGCLKGCAPGDIGKDVRRKFQKAAAVAAMQSLTNYYRENSGGLLNVDNVATLGWYTSQKPGPHYWQDHAAGKCMDGWWNVGGGGDVEKWVEAIRLAANEFDFGAFDTNGDKTLSADELAVVIMIPREAGDWGFHRAVQAEAGAPLVVRGVTIPAITEIYVGSQEKSGSDYTDGVPHLGSIAHELGHHLFGHADMYWGSPFTSPSTALGALALMDDGWSQGHQDGFSKLKFGWTRPRIIWHPGRYTLKDVETRHTLRALLHPERGVGEFLLFENRFRSGTFDRHLPADGLAIYHVMQDRSVFQRSRPPFYMSPADWAKIGLGDWGHRAVRLIRPVSNSGYVSDGGSAEGYNDFWSLWRSEQMRTSYDLEPFPASRERAWLRWGDGSNPGLAIRNVSGSGSAMAFTVAMAPPVNPALCAARGKNCGLIDDGLGDQVSCGTCTGTNTCGGGGVPNVCGCTPLECGTRRCGSLNRGCGLGRVDCGDCQGDMFCDRQNFCQKPCECGGTPPNCLRCCPCGGRFPVCVKCDDGHPRVLFSPETR